MKTLERILLKMLDAISAWGTRVQLREPKVDKNRDFIRPSADYDWNWQDGAIGLGLNAYRFACVLALIIFAVRLMNGLSLDPSRTRKSIIATILMFVIVELAVAAFGSSQEQEYQEVNSEIINGAYGTD